VKLASRIVLSIAIGVGATHLSRHWLIVAGPAFQAGDFTYPWLAARGILSGVEPYQLVATTPMPFPSAFFYPLTAAVWLLPFAHLASRIAGPIFVGLGFAILAFVLTAGPRWRLLVLITGPALAVSASVQWSPLLTAGLLWPPALAVLTAKPNLLLGLIAPQTRFRSLIPPIIVGLVITGVSFAIEPSWPVHWLATLRANPAASQYRFPLFHPLGICLAIAAIRWRRADTRLLLGMAISPQNGFFYDQLPLMLIPKTPIELVIAVTLSQVGLHYAERAGLGLDPVAQSAARFPYVVAFLYLPALVMVLRRPNESSSLAIAPADQSSSK